MNTKKKSAKDVNWQSAPSEAVDVYQAILLESLKEKTDKTNELLATLINSMSHNKSARPLIVSPRGEMTLKDILVELQSRRDAGDYEYVTGTASTTLKVIDVENVAPYHKVKGFILKNDDGTDTIQFAFNNNTKFTDVQAREDLKWSNNDQVISKFFIRTGSGLANYRLWYYW